MYEYIMNNLAEGVERKNRMKEYKGKESHDMDHNKAIYISVGLQYMYGKENVKTVGLSNICYTSPDKFHQNSSG